MPRVVFTHAVRDRAHWAGKHSERVEAFASWGSNVIDYLGADGGNDVAAHGVLEPLTIHIEKK
jgi:hypothetical protein